MVRVYVVRVLVCMALLAGCNGCILDDGGVSVESGEPVVERESGIPLPSDWMAEGEYKPQPFVSFGSVHLEKLADEEHPEWVMSLALLDASGSRSGSFGVDKDLVLWEEEEAKGSLKVEGETLTLDVAGWSGTPYTFSLVKEEE